MIRYCYIDKKGDEHCHCFENGKYAGFMTNGVMSTDYSQMVDSWIKEDRSENELAEFLERAGFILKENENS